jgi:uncharacterized membrane protein YgcG
MLVRRHRDVPGFVRSLELHHSVRLHAAVLLAAAALAGFLLSRLLLWMGMETPLLRFPVAVVAGYGIFLILVDWWLHYIGVKRAAVDDAPDPGFYPSGGSHSDAVEHFAGSGGQFDGGGASAGFDEGGSGQLAATKAEVALRGKASAIHIGLEAKAQAGASMADVASGAAGAGEFAVPLFAIVAVLAVFGAWGWAIAATPSVLIETAIEVAVASGLIRSMSRTRSSTWFESLFSRTIAKALLLALSALLIGFAVRMVDPSADTLGEAVARLLSR